MTDVYERDLRDKAVEISNKLGYGEFTRTGVYCMVSGPCYETPAEVKLIHTLGGDTVGMSTVPEVVVAKHMGLKVLGVSLVTNDHNAYLISSLLSSRKCDNHDNAALFISTK